MLSVLLLWYAQRQSSATKRGYVYGPIILTDMHNHLISSTFCIGHPFECLYTSSPSSKSYLVKSFVHIPNLLSVLLLQHVQIRCSTTKRRYIYWSTILIDMHNHLISRQIFVWSPIRMSPCLFFGLNNWSGAIFCVDSKFTVSFIATTCPELDKHHIY